MSFIDVEFFYFIPFVLALYWVMSRRRVVQNVILLTASLAFYAAWNWRLLGILLGGAALDYIAMRVIAANNCETPAGASRRRFAISISLVLSFGTLAFFKYEGFFANSLNALMHGIGVSESLPVLRLLLPLGLSFYTLQRAGFVLDVYWRRAEAPRSPLDYFAFVCFFPQLAAGPISRSSELLTQLQEPRRPTAEAFSVGAYSFVVGYILKGWAGDIIGQNWVDPVFLSGAHFDRVSHVFALFGYAMQVFGDFAGYSLMAIGVARLFGITLPDNFRYPFLSQSVAELWRRWHITLNRWLFDYIFTPLTTSRGWFRGRLDVALLLTFIASGLWHGAAWTFILWGLIHGVAMVVHRNWDERYRQLCRRDRSYVQIRKSAAYKLVAWALTMGVFVLSLIPFRAQTLKQSVSFAWGIVSQQGSNSVLKGLAPFLAAAFVIGHHLLELPRLRQTRERFFDLPPAIRGIVYGMVIIFLVSEVPIAAGTFIYQQF